MVSESIQIDVVLLPKWSNRALNLVPHRTPVRNFKVAIIASAMTCQLGCGAVDKPANRATEAQAGATPGQNALSVHAGEPVEAFVYVMGGGDHGTIAQVLAMGTEDGLARASVPKLRHPDPNWPNWRELRVVSVDEMLQVQRILRSEGFYAWPPTDFAMGTDSYDATLTVYWNNGKYACEYPFVERVVRLSTKLREQISQMGTVIDSQTLPLP